jgi:putative DNA primase/helicase
VPCEVVIPVDQRDEELSDRLALELGAILTWLVDGYREWKAGGLDDPQQVTAATDAYRAESDGLGRFVDRRCLTGPHFHVRSAELFAVWCKWAADEGEAPGTQTAFSTLLVNRGFDSRKSHGRMVWHGLGLAGDGDE